MIIDKHFSEIHRERQIENEKGEEVLSIKRKTNPLKEQTIDLCNLIVYCIQEGGNKNAERIKKDYQ